VIVSDRARRARLRAPRNQAKTSQHAQDREIHIPSGTLPDAPALARSRSFAHPIRR